MTDLILAIAHHLAVFTLVALFAIELVLVRRSMSADRIAQLAGIDRYYGLVAGIVIVVGIIRVIFGDIGWQYYVGNWVFWAKMAAFLGTGLLSIVPTMLVLRWNRAARDDPGFAPPAAEVTRVRQMLVAELVLFALIPAFAAAMARGYGV